MRHTFFLSTNPECNRFLCVHLFKKLKENYGKYLERIKEQAQEIGHSEQDEREYLIVHGLMHLFGYDHMTDEDKKQMREKEKAVMALLGKN